MTAHRADITLDDACGALAHPVRRRFWSRRFKGRTIIRADTARAFANAHGCIIGEHVQSFEGLSVERLPAEEEPYV